MRIKESKAARVEIAGEEDPLMTPGEVAYLFRVDPKTVTRWACEGRLDSIRTPGGHRRFRRSVVYDLLRSATEAGKAKA